MAKKYPRIPMTIPGYTSDASSLSLLKKDEPVLICDGLAWIDARVTDPVSQTIRYKLAFVDLQGSQHVELIDSKQFSAKTLIELALGYGVVVHNAAAFAAFLKKTAASSFVQNQQAQVLVERPGWIGDDCTVFYTGQRLIAPDPATLGNYYLHPSTLSAVRQSGTLEAWYQNIGIHVERSPVALVTACTALASPFLKPLGLPSRMINLWGSKGRGKTLCLQMAATLFGNGIDPAAALAGSSDPAYVRKFATTVNGIERVLADLSPFPVLLDETTEQGGETLHALTYGMASGGGKHRLRSDLKAADYLRWLVSIVTSSECSIADAVARAGKKLFGGQLDRAIDINIDRLGIFTDFGAFETFPALTVHLKKACGRYYGTPAIAVLEYVVTHHDEAMKLFSGLAELTNDLAPEGCGDGERRVVQHLAGAFLSGMIAIYAGVFRCTVDELESAFKAVIQAWWKGRAGSLQLVADFLAENWTRVAHHAPSLDSAAIAFVWNGKVIIPTRHFQAGFDAEAGKVLDGLIALDALIREQPGRNQSRFCNNRLFGYAIRAERLLPLVNEAMPDDVNAVEVEPDPHRHSPRIIEEELL